MIELTLAVPENANWGNVSPEIRDPHGHMQVSRQCLHSRSLKTKGKKERKSQFTQVASFHDANILTMVNFQQLM